MHSFYFHHLTLECRTPLKMSQTFYPSTNALYELDTPIDQIHFFRVLYKTTLILSTNLTSFKTVYAEVRMFSCPLFLSKAIWTALTQMRRKKFLKLFDCLEPGILWSHKETLLLIYRPEGRLS